jgi:Dolichyl-phosphate-mannose-protein mannosyltransferase
MNPLMTAQPTDNPAPIRLFWLYLLMITLLAGGMRLYQLGDYSFWEDELYTVRSASALDQGQFSKRFGHLPSAWGMMAQGADLSEVNQDNVARWKSLGVSEWGARIGPCLVGILTIPLLALAGRRLLGDRATLIAALLLTVSPWHLFWSQAARFYALQFLCYNLALIWYLRCCRERKTQLAALSAVALVMAYLSQPPALVIGLVLAGDVLGCLIRREPIGLSKAGWALGIGAVVVCLGIQYYDSTHSQQDWAAWGKLEGHSWKVLAASMVLRNHPVLLAVAALSVLGLIRKMPRLTLYLLMAGTLPVLALMALPVVGGMLKMDIYVHERYCFVVHYAWVALAALGLSAVWDVTKEHRGTALAGAGVAAVAVSLLWTDLGYYQDGNRRRWREAFAYVQPLRQPGEDVAVLSSRRTPIARYYLETDDVLPYADFPTSPQKLDALTRPTWLVLPAVSATRGELFPWLNDRAELKRYYDLRILQPFASIRVYYYRPEKSNGPDPD